MGVELMVNQLIAENKVDKFHRFCKLFNISTHNMLNLNIDSRVVAIIIGPYCYVKFKNDLSKLIHHFNN